MSSTHGGRLHGDLTLQMTIHNGNGSGVARRGAGIWDRQRGDDGICMVEEEVAVGHVGWSSLKLFLLSFGGFWFWLVCLGGFMLSDAVLTLQSYWIG